MPFERLYEWSIRMDGALRMLEVMEVICKEPKEYRDVIIRKMKNDKRLVSALIEDRFSGTMEFSEHKRDKKGKKVIDFAITYGGVKY